MTTTHLILLIIAGLLAGFVSGFFGVGGAIIIIPILVFLLGLSQQQAQGTSLMVLVFPVGIFAVLNYAKQGYVNFKFAFVIIAAFVVGSYLGSLVTLNISERVLQKSFAILLFVIGLKMFFNK